MSQLSGRAGDLPAAWHLCLEARATWATVPRRCRRRAKDPSWEACSAAGTSRVVPVSGGLAARAGWPRESWIPATAAGRGRNRAPTPELRRRPYPKLPGSPPRQAALEETRRRRDSCRWAPWVTQPARGAAGRTASSPSSSLWPERGRRALLRQVPPPANGCGFRDPSGFCGEMRDG